MTSWRAKLKIQSFGIKTVALSLSLSPLIESVAGLAEPCQTKARSQALRLTLELNLYARKGLA